ncbi:hypothetical protein CIHG_02419 [Coccidioides immitis H538.4]|uniref:Uncharacterized protein n=3 Tax=Coccidioides immitis TaxID=5501 RepID=A0A0J8RCM1_COCIT|nr:hypothetical protein CIRG_00581 [Coccidioides immitis RMSCC 2394]KMU81638.1 hypothetical protein CISG_09251 [Coccidioides immitis RMSCC 3703]KMU84633.1 hypothetical protein CIHG_02419 [Coccidioides immitis H538.4]
MTISATKTATTWLTVVAQTALGLMKPWTVSGSGQTPHTGNKEAPLQGIEDDGSEEHPEKILSSSHRRECQCLVDFNLSPLHPQRTQKTRPEASIEVQAARLDFPGTRLGKNLVMMQTLPSTPMLRNPPRAVLTLSLRLLQSSIHRKETSPRTSIVGLPGSSCAAIFRR